jgi:hypothetical protein
MQREVRRDERSPSTRSAPVSPIPAQASGSKRLTTPRRIDASMKERPFPQIRGLFGLFTADLRGGARHCVTNQALQNISH